MHTTVRIENEMPKSLRCTGIYYQDTKDLNLKELVLFMERDLFAYLKKADLLKPTFTISLIQHEGISQVRIAISVLYHNAVEALRPYIENILWSYNQQLFSQEGGKLKALPPRFQFRVEITGRDKVNTTATETM